MHHFINICAFKPELRLKTTKLGFDLCDLDPWPLTMIFCMVITYVNSNNSKKRQGDTITRTLWKKCFVPAKNCKDIPLHTPSTFPYIYVTQISSSLLSRQKYLLVLSHRQARWWPQCVPQNCFGSRWFRMKSRRQSTRQVHILYFPLTIQWLYLYPLWFNRAWDVKYIMPNYILSISYKTHNFCAFEFWLYACYVCIAWYMLT